MYNCGPTVYGRQHIGNWRTNVLLGRGSGRAL